MPNPRLEWRLFDATTFVGLRLRLSFGGVTATKNLRGVKTLYPFFTLVMSGSFCRTVENRETVHNYSVIPLLGLIVTWSGQESSRGN
jgi:hypothetical protein